jgi:serine/threonine-protein kinase
MEADLERVARGAPVSAATAATQVIPVPAAAAAAVDSTSATMIAPVPAAPARRDVPPPVVHEEEYVEPGGPGRPVWPWLLAAAFVIAAAIAGFFVWHELSNSTVKEPVALYQGERASQAVQQIKAAHLVPDVKHGSNEKYKKGFVYDQSPDPGSKVDKGGTVTIYVSSGPPPVSVPDVKGKQWPDAEQELSQAGLKPVEHIVPGNTKGKVTATSPPAGKSVPKGTTVRVNVMSGPQQLSVPNVVGESVTTALANLHSAGFNGNPTIVPSDAPQGQVIHQNPAPGSSEAKGTTVDLQVSAGPPQVTITDVVGYSATQAVQTLQGEGFKVVQQYQTVSDQSEDGVVLAQSPAGNAQAAKGSTVTITVGQYSAGPPPGTTTTTTG